jgi:hypothetical protein
MPGLDWVIDSDTHVTEPPDTWTSRLPAKFRDRAPRIVNDPRFNWDVWQIGSARAAITVGHTAVAGWPEPFPAAPLRGRPEGGLGRAGASRVHGLDRRLGGGALP